MALPVGGGIYGHAMDAALLGEKSVLDLAPEVHRLPPADVGGKIDVMGVSMMPLGMVVPMDVHAPVKPLDRLVAEDELLGNEEGTGVHLVEVPAEFLDADVMVTSDKDLVRVLAGLPDVIPYLEASHVTEMNDGVVAVDGVAEDGDVLLWLDPVGVHELAVEVIEVRVADDEHASLGTPAAERFVELLDHGLSAPLSR